MRARWPLLVVLAACGPDEPGPKPVGQDPPHDDAIDVPSDTSTPPVPRAVLLPWDDTDDTGRPGESDSDTVPPIDSGTDTFVFADTDPDSAAPPLLLTTTTTQNVHDRLHVPGQLLEIGPLVVTAVRRTLSPPATNGFAVQDPSLPAPKHGLYVDLRDGLGTPAVGDLVSVTGLYTEWPTHAPSPSRTMPRLVVHPSIPGSSVVHLGAGVLPPPFDVTLDDLGNPQTAEDLEGMLLRVDEGQALQVLGTPSRTSEEFPVGIPLTLSVMVDPWFFDYVAALPVRPGASMDALVGVLLYEPNAHKLAPRGIDDLEGWTNP